MKLIHLILIVTISMLFLILFKIKIELDDISTSLDATLDSLNRIERYVGG